MSTPHFSTRGQHRHLEGRELLVSVDELSCLPETKPTSLHYSPARVFDVLYS